MDLQALWITLFVVFVISLFISFSAYGKSAKETVKELFGVGKRKIAPLFKEVRRKTFHLVGLLIPSLYYYGLRFGYLTKYNTSVILGSLSLFLVVTDILRINSESFRKVFMAVAGRLIREKEHDKLNGSTNFVLGSFLTIFFFHHNIAIAAMLMLILGDLSAALVGRAYGATKVVGNKSLEGSLAMLFVSMIFGMASLYDFPLFEYIATAGAIAATCTELLPVNLDDNLTIPLSSGFVMTMIRWRIQNFCTV